MRLALVVSPFVLAAFLSSSASAQTFEVDSPAPPVPYTSAADVFAYVVLDGHWYTTVNYNPFFWFDGTGFFMPGAVMDFCRRADGQAQQFGGIGFYYGQFFAPVYQITGFSMRQLPSLPGRSVIELQSQPGNIICNNEVPPPVSSIIFADGFDPSERIFTNGFEGSL
jgi:hypothetical protein